MTQVHKNPGDKQDCWFCPSLPPPSPLGSEMDMKPVLHNTHEERRERVCTRTREHTHIHTGKGTHSKTSCLFALAWPSFRLLTCIRAALGPTLLAKEAFLTESSRSIMAKVTQREKGLFTPVAHSPPRSEVRTRVQGRNPEEN